MEDMIKQIEGIIETNNAIKERTPWLNVSRGGLQTALHNAQKHVEAVAKGIEATPETIAAAAPAKAKTSAAPAK